MFPLDIAVWERFLTLYGDNYEGFYYDVKVGKPAKIPKHWSNEYQRGAEVLSKLRIDAIGVMSNTYSLFEVKPRATASAIGQLLTYRHWFQDELAGSKLVQPILLAEEFVPNLYPVLEDVGIAWIKV